MGGSGGDYSADVNYVRKSSTSSGYSSTSKDEIMKKSGPDKSVLAINFPGIEIYKDQDIVIVIIDGTGSMGEDAFIIRDKIVLLEGQLRIQGYLRNPLVMVCIVGDANSDSYPIQITKPERGDALIAEIEKTYPEGKGGGQGMESYELMAYYFVNHMKLDDTAIRPYLFFLGDEGIYPEVDASHIREFIGDNLKGDLDSGEVFKKLCRKFNVFRLHREYNGGSYSSGDDDRIFKQWQKMIGSERVQRLDVPKAVVDIILGVIAIGSKSRTRSQYLNDLRGKGKDPNRVQDETRISEVDRVLIGIENAIVPISDVPKLPSAGDSTKKRSSGSKRLN